METFEDSDFATGEDFRGQGFRSNKHGYDYQMLQFLLFAMRALKHEPREFGLASDIQGGETFDDIVFTRPKGDAGDGRAVRCIQVKHSQDKNKGIEMAQLLSEGPREPFSLQNYFISYVKINKNNFPMGLLKPKDSIEDLVILSNYGYVGKSGDSETEEDVFEDIGRDVFLSNNAVKFKSEFKGKKDLVLLLKKGFVDMPHEFSRSVTRGKGYVYSREESNVPHYQLYSTYWRALTTEVLNKDGNSFLDNFILDANLSQAACHFREELYSKYMKVYGNGELFIKYLQGISIVQPKDKVANPLENSRRVKSLAEKIVKLVKDHRDSKLVNITKADGKILMDSFLIPVGGMLVYRPQFMKEKLPHKLPEFKNVIVKSEVNMEELREYKFCILKDIARQKIPETSEQLDFEVKEFLNKVKFVFGQGGIDESKKMLFQEIANQLVPQRNDIWIEYVCNRLLKEVDAWMGMKSARFLMRKDLEKLFKERRAEIEGEISFQLREPEADCVFRGKLESIRTFFKQDGLSVKKCLVLRGLGGMGKTELAREYAQQTRKSSYDHTIWINSRSVERFERSLRDLVINRLAGESSIVCAENTGPGELLKKLFAYFIQKRTLFIFDDASEETKRYILPSSSDVTSTNGCLHILVTSESKKWDGFTIENLEKITKDEANDIIKQLAGDTTRFSEQDARALCEKLSFYPLALKLAVSYIVEKDNVLKDAGRSFPIANYLQLLEEEGMPADANGTNQRDTYKKTVAKILNISCKEIEKTNLNSLANRLLSVMSYLMPDNIPVAALRTPEFKYTPDDLGSCLKVLKSYSVLTVNNAKVSMHPVVQEVIRHSLRAEGGEEGALKHAIPVCRLMGIEHRMSVWRYAKEYSSLTELCSDIPSNVTIILCDTQMPSRAKNFATGAMEKMMENPGRTHKDTISLRIALCYAHKKLGQEDKRVRVTNKIVSDVDALKNNCEVKQLADTLQKSMETLPDSHGIRELTLNVLGNRVFERAKASFRQNLTDPSPQR